MIDEYQDAAAALSSLTGIHVDNEEGAKMVGIDQKSLRLLMAAIGLCEEAGEFAGLVKKAVFHGHELDLTKAAKEIGDTAWYLNEAATACNLRTIEILRTNLAKLRARYGEKFSKEASINRKSEAEEDAAADALKVTYG